MLNGASSHALVTNPSDLRALLKGIQARKPDFRETGTKIAGLTVSFDDRYVKPWQVVFPGETRVVDTKSFDEVVGLIRGHYFATHG